MLKKRHKTRKISFHNKLYIGGGTPIVVESMANAEPHDAQKIIKQIIKLEQAGCGLVRITLPDILSTDLIPQIKKKISIPLMGDIHFNHEIALKAIENGIDSIRINPGNIRDKTKIKMLVKSVKKNNIPVRVGANTGSINRKKYKGNKADALVKSVMEHIKLFEEENYKNLIISLKSSDVLTTIEAYKKFSKLRNYPLHIGITEAGTQFSGTIKSAVGLGILLYEGLGDTLRVSLSCDPVEEVYTGYKLLQALGLSESGVEVISCPTCGRTGIDVEKIANQIEQQTRHIKKKVKVAVMGCIVNGPGEAIDADIGVAGMNNKITLFKKGKLNKTIIRKEIIPEIMKFINSHTG